MAQTFGRHRCETDLGFLVPPKFEVPIIFLFSDAQKDVHILIPETSELPYVQYVADNFSARVRQPVKVFHDADRKKYRLCPIPEGISPNTSSFGRFCFTRDNGAVQGFERSQAVEAEYERRIPRPRNSWILYRQAKSQEVASQNPGMPTTSISKIISDMWKSENPEVKAYWQQMAEREDRNHKLMYPDYKYTTSRASNGRKPLAGS
ncbi:hypothetical protein FDECE_16832, partial [Fusarium decemcellulare]